MYENCWGLWMKDEKSISVLEFYYYNDGGAKKYGVTILNFFIGIRVST